MSGASFNPRQWLHDHGDSAEETHAPPNPPNSPNPAADLSGTAPRLGILGGLGGERVPTGMPHTRAEHDIHVLAVRVRVAIWRNGGMVTGVELVTRDEARRPLAEAIDARLRAGVGLAQQAVEQAALANLLRELRQLELAAPAEVVT